MFSTLDEWVGSIPTSASRLIGARSGLRHTKILLKLTYDVPWLTWWCSWRLCGHPSCCPPPPVLLSLQWQCCSFSLRASSRAPQLSYCHGFLLAVMYNHRGLEQYQACEDLSLLFNDKTSLEMRTWCIHNETLNDMTKWGSFLIPLAVSDRVILSSKTTNEREKNKLD